MVAAVSNGKKAELSVIGKDEPKPIVRKKADITQKLSEFSEPVAGEIQGQNIKSIAQKEETIAYEIEYARLQHIETAKQTGREKARSQFRKDSQNRIKAEKKYFVDNELPEILSTCEFLEYDRLKVVVNQIAGIAGVNLKWEELENGEYQCTPTY